MTYQTITQNPIESLRSILFYVFFITLLPTHLISENNSNPWNPRQATIQMTKQEVQKKLDRGVTPKELIDEGAEPSAFIGLLYDGGMIFQINTFGEGLMAALVDHDEMVPWGCKGFSILGNNDSNSKSGQKQTKAILDNPCHSNDGVTCAAEICAQFKGGNHNDWFLPSLEELEQMYASIGQGSGNNVGGFEDANYWSSTEGDRSTAVMQQFVNGSHGPDLKSFKVRVRPVRAF